MTFLAAEFRAALLTLDLAKWVCTGWPLCHPQLLGTSAPAVWARTWVSQHGEHLWTQQRRLWGPPCASSVCHSPLLHLDNYSWDPTCDTACIPAQVRAHWPDSVPTMAVPLHHRALGPGSLPITMNQPSLALGARGIQWTRLLLQKQVPGLFWLTWGTQEWLQQHGSGTRSQKAFEAPGGCHMYSSNRDAKKSSHT